MEHGSDEDLVRRILKGKTQVYAQLVERYERPVFNLMYRYCRCEQEAADLSQDVFLRAFERLTSYNGQQKFFPWMYTLALNRARDWQRKNSRKQRKLAELCWEVPVDGIRSQQEKQLLKQEEVVSLYGALDTLPDDTREMVLLRYKQELSISEIAAIFQFSESAVKMRILRALERMRSVLEGDRHDG